ncbi:NUDIX hydrolase [Shewanella salipaludis]|uniref:Phosphatase NudJ n=1 Tax=Shewanella salipaludis TaxID=2723052 RepID=A0A972FR49_9GAMM|nr:NUDIX hydrolase [Shewanella salipaludis]NMH64226.1 NUDIX hydrolase [Shewanella salipaludis]
MSQRYKPNVTVACIIQCREQFLMVEEQIDGVRRYNQPAGHLEPGESLIAACQREVYEETGLKLMPDALVGIYQFSADAELAFVRFTFCASLDEPNPTAPRDEAISAALWLSLDELIALEQSHRSPLVLASLRDYLQGRRYPLELLDSRSLNITPGIKP